MPHIIKYCSIFLIIGTSACGGLSKNSSMNTASCAKDIETGSFYNVTRVPEKSEKMYKNNFCKYTSLVAPNGKSIHFYAQDRISNEQMLRAKDILSFYLENVKGSQYGSDKSSVFNSMANNNATLIMLNGSDDGTPPADGQTLYETENVIEGSSAYFSGEPRDAAYEEILHLMHDTGIGVDGQNGGDGVLKNSYQAEIRNAMQNAIPSGVIDSKLGEQKGLWANTSKDWLKELAPENSLTQEYLASIIDTYYGLTGKASPEGFYDLYKPQSREDIKVMDKKGWALVGGDTPRKFFSEYVTRIVRLDPIFKGTFTLTLDDSKPYTYKSRFLTKVKLLGDHDVNIHGNAQNNMFFGNSGNNKFDGMGGVDSVFFKGNQADYSLEKVTLKSGVVATKITDSVTSRDGTDTLVNIERAIFNDASISIK